MIDLRTHTEIVLMTWNEQVFLTYKDKRETQIKEQKKSVIKILILSDIHFPSIVFFFTNFVFEIG